MERIKVQRNGDILTIGETPKLVVNLQTQENYIEISERKIPYQREIALSADLLAGKRVQVFETAIRHYYMQACQVAEGIKIAQLYRPRMNTTTREVKKNM